MGGVQRHPAVPAGHGGVTHPQDLPGGGELVEHGGLVVGDPGGEHQGLQRAGGHPRPRQLLDHPQQPVHPPDPARTAPLGRRRRFRHRHRLPRRQEAGQVPGGDGLDLLAQRGQGPSPQDPQDAGVAEVQHVGGPADLDRPDRTGGDASRLLQPPQRLLGHRHAQPEPRGRLPRPERAVRPGVPGQQVPDRVGHRDQERLRQAYGQRGPHGVPQPGRVLDRRHAATTPEADLDGPALLDQGGQVLGRAFGLQAAVGDLVGAHRAEDTEQVRHVLGVPGLALGDQALQLGLGGADGLRVEQVAQRRAVTAAEQLRQQLGVQGQGSGPALGQGGVALVQELRDVAEQQRAGERGGGRRLDLDHAHLTGGDLAHEGHEPRDVEHVLQALPDGLQDDREGRVAARHVQQGGRSLPLLPQRLTSAGMASRQQQRAGGALPEPRREQRRPTDLLGDHVLHVVGLEHDELGDVRRGHRFGGRPRGTAAPAVRIRPAEAAEPAAQEAEAVVRAAPPADLDVRQAQDDAVVAVHGLDVDAVPLPEPGRQRERPRCVDLPAEGGVDAHPPVAELVAEPLDHDGAVVGHVARGLLLLPEVGQQVVGGPLVQAGRGAPGTGAVRLEPDQLPDERPHGPAELGRATEGVTAPERQLARASGGRGDEHLVAGDVLHLPGARAQRDDVAHAGLVDHLLVQLPDPPTGPLGARQEHPEQAAVGDGSAAGDRQTLRAGSARQGVGHPVPHQPGSQLGELLARVAPGQHVQRGLERAPGQVGEARRATDQRVQVVDGPVVHRAHGDHLLGQHVQRGAQHPQGLDLPGHHPLDHDGALHEVGTVLGEHDAAGDGADLVPRTTDPLQPAGHARRGLHLHDEVDRSHVDAELEAAGGHDGGQASGLEVVLDEGALLLADGAVVGTGQHQGRPGCGPGLAHHLRGGPAPVCLGRLTLLLGRVALLPHLVDLGGEALGQAPGVGEDQRRGVGGDEVDHPLVDVGPDGASLLLTRRAADDLARGGAQVGQVGHGHDHRHVELLVRRGVHDPDRTPAGLEPRHLLDRAHGRRQPDPLRGGVEEGVEALQGERQVGAPLGAGDGVDLVQDDRADPEQRLPGLGRDEQEQRLRRGDEHVRRAQRERATLGGRGVAGADADGDVRHGGAEALRAGPDAGQGGAEVALDVDGEGFERGDVQHPAATLRLLRHRFGGEPVQRPQERGQGLARPRRGDHQGVLAAAHRVPRPQLGGRGRGEGAGEPVPRRRGEPSHDAVGGQGAGHVVIIVQGSDIHPSW